MSEAQTTWAGRSLTVTDAVAYLARMKRDLPAESTYCERCLRYWGEIWGPEYEAKVREEWSKK